MNVLIISRGYPNEKYKMNGIFEFDQAKALANAGHKIIYAAVDLRSVRRIRKFGFESIYKDNVYIEAINIPCGRIPKFILNKISIIALKKLYSKILKKYGRPDIIHAHFIQYGYITAKVFENKNIPIVLTEHYSAMNEDIINPYYFKLGSNTYSKVNKVLAVSSYLAANIKNKFNIDAEVVPNIVDTEAFEFKTNTDIKKDDMFNFVSIGSLNKNKRMDMLIKAFYKGFKDYNNIKLFIFGDGPERKYLELLISKLKLEDKVFLMGLISREKIAEKLSCSNCFVLASKHETFGVAFIEAMAMGLPVIATKCGGPEDFVNESNGILIDKDNEEKLANAMQKMYNDIKKYDNKKISYEIKEKFSPQIVAKKLELIYFGIIDKENKNG